MFNLTRKGLWAHKVRFLLTGLAVILGVAFMAGTMILTDTMGKTFDGLFATSNEGIDVVVHRTTGVDSNGGIDVQERVDASLVDTIKAVDGVDAAAGSIEGFAQVIGPDGTPLHTRRRHRRHDRRQLDRRRAAQPVRPVGRPRAGGPERGHPRPGHRGRRGVGHRRLHRRPRQGGHRST